MLLPPIIQRPPSRDNASPVSVNVHRSLYQLPTQNIIDQATFLSELDQILNIENLVKQ